MHNSLSFIVLVIHRKLLYMHDVKFFLNMFISMIAHVFLIFHYTQQKILVHTNPALKSNHYNSQSTIICNIW